MKRVVTECKPDEELLFKIGFRRNEIEHQPSKGEVCNYLKKQNKFLALMDEDPLSSQPKYLSEFSLVEESAGVKKLTHNQTGHTIAVLQPRLEEWIYKQCQVSGINPTDFQFPAHAKEFKDVINKHLLRYSRMLDALIEKKNVGIMYLKATLNNG